MTFWEKLYIDKENYKLTFHKVHKYRCEQTVITKLNEIPTCTIQTKSDYTTQGVSDENGNKAYEIKLDENIVSIFPEQYTEAIKLVEGLEKIKSNVVLSIDKKTGKMERILNIKDLMDNWENYKKKLNHKYSFLRDKKSVEGFVNFMNIADKQISEKNALLAELNMKMPFAVFFDKYLISDVNLDEPYSMDFNSALFDKVGFPLEIKQKIEKESLDEVLLSRKGIMPKKLYCIDNIEKIYNEKYKPAVQYSFSTYNLDYSAILLLNATEKIIKEAVVNIIEEVSNNVNLNINFTMRMIK